ncbi:MAG: hypothetical protein FWG12_05575 [Holophagaceae bacterium]|nr:hypothetical protein [Holophagaceae bacterium]
MFQQIVQIEPPSPPPERLVFQNYQKAGLLILVAAILYLRLSLRKRRNDKICPHCEARNPYHMSNCAKCFAPLLNLSFLKDRSDSECE